MSEHRRIVICMDGTWNNPYQVKLREDGTKVLKPSNALKVCRAVVPFDAQNSVVQVSYYDSGVGALGTYPGFANALLRKADANLGGPWGAGFEANVEEAATFLVNNYQLGDQVFVFGFSRGAAQAQALTRFIDWMGGVPVKSDAYFVPLYFQAYINSAGTADPAAVKTAGGDSPAGRLTPVEVTMLGVFDTVMSLGGRFKARKETTGPKRSFHAGHTPARCVKNARQALAIDERRYDFRPEIWHDHLAGQTLEQRWFAGVHSNVGGGYVRDGLANIPLRWMLREAGGLGLVLDDTFLGHYRAYPQAKLNQSTKWYYELLDALRFRRGKGVRSLTGFAAEAKLSVDRSVFHRMAADPAEHEQLEQYRPLNVIQYLATQPDLAAYFTGIGLPAGFTLPGDILREIALRSGRT